MEHLSMGAVSTDLTTMGVGQPDRLRGSLEDVGECQGYFCKLAIDGFRLSARWGSLILYGHDQKVCDWVSEKLFGVPEQFEYPYAKGIGIVRDDKLIAGVVYDGIRTYPDGRYHQCEMSIASVDKKWCTRHTLRELFAYPFIQLRLERAQTTCSASNEGVIMFNQRLGFVKEGVHRQAWPMGGDAISWSMLPQECRWL